MLKHLKNTVSGLYGMVMIVIMILLMDHCYTSKFCSEWKPDGIKSGLHMQWHIVARGGSVVEVLDC